MIDWIDVRDKIPDERVLAYTPNDDLVIRYRIIPKGMFKQVAKDATHWADLNDPATPPSE